MRSLLSRHPVRAYFVMAYAGSWLVWLPLVLSREGFGIWHFRLASLPSLWVRGAGYWMGPAFAGIVLTCLLEGNAGLRRLARISQHGYQRRALILFLSLSALFIPVQLWPVVVVAVSKGQFQSVLRQMMLSFYVYSAFFNCLPLNGSPLPEEIGWRGFAVPRLESRCGVLLASLLMGLLWWLWHTPLFFTSWSNGFKVGEYLLFGAYVVSLSLLFSWVFHLSGGSVWCAVMLHGAINASASLYPYFQFPDASGKLISWNLHRALEITIIILGALLALCMRGLLGWSPASSERQTEQPASQTVSE